MSHDANLEPTLRAVEPALRLVHVRHLRQVLNFLIDRGRPLPTNTDLPFWLTRADLAAAAVLPPATLAGTEPRLLLVTTPNDRMIEDLPREAQLRTYWRVLFRAAAMNAIDLKLASGALDAETCRVRLNRFGPAVAREIRFVLESESLVAPNADDVEVYRAFVAVYFDLDCFKPHGTEEFFPTLSHDRAGRAALEEDIDAGALFAASRPAGAAEPERETPADERWSAPPAGATAETALLPSGASAAILKRADDAERKGNFVRAAVLRTQAAGATQGLDRERAMTAALGAVGQLVTRLGDMLEWDADTREEWRQALGPLLPLAARGIWPRAARYLYELQRIPADYAREVYAVDLPEYLRTFGRRPIRRHLPHARSVMVLMAFRKAHKQLLRAGLDEAEQLRLDRLMHHEMQRRESAIRNEFAPIIAAEITAAGLVPANRVEEVARDKLVAELLDRVCDRGYLRIGDLRDAVARNRLKLPDLAGAGEFLCGDALLRADNGLAYALDGVYRRGEFYLRWIQRFASLFFGTPWGRALTLYLALPFGGAFLTLMFAEEVRQIGGKAAKLVSRSFAPSPAKTVSPSPVAPAPTPGVTSAQTPAPTANPPDVLDWQFDEDELKFYVDEPGPPPEPEPLPAQFLKVQRERASLAKDVLTASDSKKSSFLIQRKTILGFGVFLLLVFHVPPFRRLVFLVLTYLWWTVRGILWDVPVAVWHSQALRTLRLSSTARFVHRHFASPLLVSLLVLGILFVIGVPPVYLVQYGWAVFLGVFVVYSTPPGWEFQDRIAEALSDWWRRVRTNLIPGLIGGIIDLFRMFSNWVERQLYAVDEWMRFRSGDSQSSLALKAVLGLIWFPIAYMTRFAFYLLVEPQINPVKHFPVVTVSHKVMLPLVFTEHTHTELSMFGEVLATHLGLGISEANFWAIWIVAGVPGIFGFIAWELMENWRLYAANRATALNPAKVGSHGESMRGLLRPGFHSGTVPKLYRKARKALTTDDRAWAAVLHHDLHHAAEGVHRFAERELIPLLAGNRDWGGITVEVTAIRFGAQRAEVELAASALGRDPFVLAFENLDGQIEASVARIGWADKLTDTQRAVFGFALRGLLDLAVATRFDGCERTPDAPDEPGFGALTRRVTWNEWVQRWDAARAEEKPANPPH